MNAYDRDRVQLLFGPYRPPRLRVGDRATCLLRDCEVIITSITDAPIPWPRCRALGGRGGSGPWLGGDLEEAIRQESAAAVRYWWGLSVSTVWKMRKALSVTRTNNEGTQRLVWHATCRGHKLFGKVRDPNVVGHHSHGRCTYTDRRLEGRVSLKRAIPIVISA